ncbi:MAG: poly(R)-hydroxyalkanoic acid synthase subunit PhaE [Steroidobacteraceae bacterium]
MERTAPPGGSMHPEAAFAAAMERFAQLLRACQNESNRATDPGQAMQSLGTRLAAEGERWLRESASALAGWLSPPGLAESAGPWFRQAGIPPLAPSSPHPRTLDLLTRWIHLQAQLGILWNTVARSASEKFTERVGTALPDLEMRSIRKLYDLWIECAEEAYAATAHTEEYCRTQAELINTMTALVLAQRQHAERVAGAFGLPTRSEMDELQSQLKALRSGLHADRERGRKKAKRKKRGAGN